MLKQVPDVERRRGVLMVLLAVGVVGGAIFAVLDFESGLVHLAAADGVLALAGAGLLLAARQGTRIQALILAGLPILFGVVLLRFATPQVAPTALVWLPVIPVLAYLLLERRTALMMSLVFLVAAGAAYWLRARAIPELAAPAAVTEILFVCAAVVVLCHASARRREDSDAELHRRASTDPLTGLNNRDEFQRRFDRERRHAHLSGEPVSVILIDLDEFKQVNDRFGHDAGDAALVFVAQLLRRSLRQSDVVARVGGEEFAVMLPGTNGSRAARLADALRITLEDSKFHYEGTAIALALSAGVAELGRDGGDWQELYRTADSRMYAAKNRGSAPTSDAA